MTTNDPEPSWFVGAMVKATTDMWNKGWDERNGGNVTLRLLDSYVAPFVERWKVLRTVVMTEMLPELAGQYFLATASGGYFRNVQLDPERNIGVFRVAPDGRTLELVWGFGDDGVPTSEISAHLKSHRVRQRLFGDKQRVVMHCHATNLLALTYVLDLETANVTRALWEGSTECLVVFPEGIAALPWMVPGTDDIGDATAEQMAEHPMVLWPHHGVFAGGRSLDEAFGLIDTAEKSAEVLVKVIAMGGVRQTMTTTHLVQLAKRFNVTPYAPALKLDGWKLAAARRPLEVVEGTVSRHVG
jgi:rhamnulose-1-phosphate aldolase